MANEVPFSFIEFVALMFTNDPFVMHGFALDMLVGMCAPTFKLVAAKFVHDTVTIDAFTELIFTNEHVIIDPLLHDKLKKLAVRPDIDIHETFVNLHVCTLALVEKTLLNEHVVMQQFVRDALDPFITAANDMFVFHKIRDTF